MKILCISDTHNAHEDLNMYFSSDAMEKNGIDTVIHSGDFTNNGSFAEIEVFLRWFSNLPVKHKILIAGNHEITLDPHKYKANPEFYLKDENDRADSNKSVPLMKDLCDQGKIVYLENETKVIDGVKFFGSPFSLIPPYNSTALAFQYNDTILGKIWSTIPDDTDVVITHTPPHGVLDSYGEHFRGSQNLRQEILNRVRPSLHVFGHVHASNGHRIINDVTFVNAVSVNGNRKVKNQPFLIEV